MLKKFRDWLDYPALNFKAIPRIIKGMFEFDPKTRTYYDQQGGVVPYGTPVVYDPFGQRHEMDYHYETGEELGYSRQDPTAYKSMNHPLFIALSSYFSPTTNKVKVTKYLSTPSTMVPSQIPQLPLPKLGFYEDVILGHKGHLAENIARAYSGFTPGRAEFITQELVKRGFRLPMQPGNMIGRFWKDEGGDFYDTQTFEKLEWGSLGWMQAQYEDDIPDIEFEAMPGEAFDASFEEMMALDNRAYEAWRWNNQGLVKIGQPPVGETFYVDGQRAIMGRPTKAGKMQYSLTMGGEGDRWKYKIAQDADGNWVRTYYRTYGAKREKQERLKRKGKDE